MSQDDQKQAAAEAALSHVEHNTFIGVGTGSTANRFIDALATKKASIEGAVASSEASAERLRSHAIPVVELNAVSELSVYVDGADEVSRHAHMIKGGGGELTREKIVAQASARLVCIVDDSKVVNKLGAFPLPVEVVPMARSFVARELVKLGGTPEWRADFLTDNGNLILDVHNLDISEPVALESEINQIPGVVCNGIFARRRADLVIVGTDSGVQEFT